MLGKLFSHLSSDQRISSLLYAFQEVRQPRTRAVYERDAFDLKYLLLPDGPEQAARDARAQARLDRDLTRILVLQGEPQPDPTPAFYYYGASRNPVAQLNESLRSAIAIPETPTTPIPAPQAGPPPKSTSRHLLVAKLGPADEMCCIV